MNITMFLMKVLNLILGSFSGWIKSISKCMHSNVFPYLISFIVLICGNANCQTSLPTRGRISFLSMVYKAKLSYSCWNEEFI